MERERERERERHQYERETSISCLLYLLSPGIKRITFWCMDNTPTSRATWLRQAFSS